MTSEKRETDPEYRERLALAIPAGAHYTAEEIGTSYGAHLDAIGAAHGCPRGGGATQTAEAMSAAAIWDFEEDPISEHVAAMVDNLEAFQDSNMAKLAKEFKALRENRESLLKLARFRLETAGKNLERAKDAELRAEKAERERDEAKELRGAALTRFDLVAQLTEERDAANREIARLQEDLRLARNRGEFECLTRLARAGGFDSWPGMVAIRKAWQERDKLRDEPLAEAVRRKVRQAEAAVGEPLYFIQDARTWHGDMIVFWGMNGNGYVIDIMMAGLYPAAHSIGRRESDLYWRPEDLLGSLTICANSERLQSKKPQEKPLIGKKG